MPSVAFGAAALIVWRSFMSAARLSVGAAAMYSATFFGRAVFAAGFFFVSVAMAIQPPSGSLLLPLAIEGQQDPAHAFDAAARPARLSLKRVKSRCGVHLQHRAPLRRCIGWSAEHEVHAGEAQAHIGDHPNRKRSKLGVQHFSHQPNVTARAEIAAWQGLHALTLR